MARYPDELVRKRILFDGSEATIRPIKDDDAPIEADFVRHLSPESRYTRFMATVNELPPTKLRYLTDIDYDKHMAFVATVIREGKEVEIGVSRYVVDPNGTSCEFAIAVDDAWQGSGVAGILMATLIDTARARGLKAMEGIVLGSNHKMLKFARQLGFSLHRDMEEPDTVNVTRPL